MMAITGSSLSAFAASFASLGVTDEASADFAVAPRVRGEAEKKQLAGVAFTRRVPPLSREYIIRVKDKPNKIEIGNKIIIIFNNEADAEQTDTPSQTRILLPLLSAEQENRALEVEHSPAVTATPWTFTVPSELPFTTPTVMSTHRFEPSAPMVAANNVPLAPMITSMSLLLYQSGHLVNMMAQFNTQHLPLMAAAEGFSANLGLDSSLCCS